jgi:endoglucanase
MRIAGFVAGLLALPFGLGAIFHTESRWIVDENGERYKLRCVNWGGHLETNTPEGLQHQTPDYIASWIAKNGFNCVRLTYSIDMALNQTVLVEDSFNEAGAVSGVGEDAMQKLYQQALQKNSFLNGATRIDAFSAVISALADHNINVILDNHVSKAQWCCNLTDGNGWWDTAFGYNEINSQWFVTEDWLNGLKAMAQFASKHDNVIGMSVRNELRALWPQDLNNHADWYTYVGQAANLIHSTNPDLLIMIGGTASATDFSFQRFTGPFNTTGFADKAVWEFHVYSFSVGFLTSTCNVFQAQLGGSAGYLLQQGQAYTGPLWLSEYGVALNGDNGTLSSGDQAYLSCLVQYMEGNDADWSYWAIMGDYYVREGQLGYNESYGLLDPTWTDWQNPNFPSLIGAMFNVTQGPGVGTNTMNDNGCD